MRTDMQDSLASWYPNAELIFAIDTMKNMEAMIRGSRYTLAYKIPITTIEPSVETVFYYVNATNGNIIKSRSTLYLDGPANVYGYGSKILDTEWKGGFTQAYILHTNNDSRNIHTKESHSLNVPWGLIGNTTDSDDNWGSTYTTETSTHFHVTNAWEYFKHTFSRSGQDNNNRSIRVRSQLSFANAAFDPKLNHNNLYFGQSDGYDLGLDPSIVSHEYTHGITHHTANLAYEYESGALSESFSDIFGIVIPYETLDGYSTDWTVGDFFPIENARSLKEPNSLGTHWTGSYLSSGLPEYSEGQPDTYSGTYWCQDCIHPVDAGGVHINSGVQNKWFYILANGEQSTNDLNNNYNVAGIGITKAAAIAYLALTSILMNSSQYSDSRQATIQSSKMLFGECSYEYKSTIDAWYAVGLGDLNNCGSTLDNFEVQLDEIKIYPNPANETVFLEMPILPKGHVVLYDLYGKKVNEFCVQNNIFSFDVSNIESGVYTIVFNMNNQLVSKRLILKK